jgi:hypothetical protein
MKPSEIRNKITSFISEWLGRPYTEKWMDSRQCVGGAKLFVKEVYGITLWSFGGTAYTGRLNENNTFDPKIWNTINYREFDQQPSVWSLVWFAPTKENPAGHIGMCVYKLNDWKIGMLELNGGEIGKNKKWDEFNIRVRGLQNCLGYRRIKFEKN